LQQQPSGAQYFAPAGHEPRGLETQDILKRKERQKDEMGKQKRERDEKKAG
jgi:hypothetical protein